jgi:hypothetical protein
MNRAACLPVLLSLVATAPAAADRLAARAAGDDAPVVWRDESGLRVERSGRSSRLALPEGAAIDQIAAAGSGWIAAGTRPVGDRLDLYLVQQTAAGLVELPPPGDAVARFRERPAPVVAGAALRGVAWLEGADRQSYAVRFAPWLGAGFGAPVEIASPGPGSQLALSATALDDGRTLLVWSAFDGEDDEIHASVGDGRSWSKPTPVGVGNGVPDITPVAVAVPGGALVAWSRFDGEQYRLALARFDGRSFAEVGEAGPPGSIDPMFAAGGTAPRLVWFDARTDAWVLSEVATDGRLSERARAVGPVDDPPVVDVKAGKARFRFGDRVAEAPLVR